MNFNTLMHSLERKLIEPIITKNIVQNLVPLNWRTYMQIALVLKNWCKIYGIKYNKVLKRVLLEIKMVGR